MKDTIVEINFYEEKKAIKLPEKFELFKLGLKSLLGNEVELKYLNIYYKDNEKDKINIDTEEEYKHLITQIQKKEVKILEVELKQNIENSKVLNINNNSKINEDEINSEIINSKLNIKENNINQKDIIFSESCSVCKSYDLKNEIYFCQKCKNFYCFKCFEKIKKIHEHSINVIFNQNQYNDIKNNKNDNYNSSNIESNSILQSKLNDKDKNIINMNKQNNLIENNYHENNIIIKKSNNENKNEVKQNNINKNNIDENVKLKIDELRRFDGTEKFSDDDLVEILQKVNWDINKAIEKLFEKN